MKKMFKYSMWLNNKFIKRREYFLCKKEPERTGNQYTQPKRQNLDMCTVNTFG